MDNKLKIKSLQALKDWNKNPTLEKPIVLEWYLNWFFEKAIMSDDKELIFDAYKTIVEFTMISEGLSHEEATKRTNINLGYYAGYSQMWSRKLRKYFPVIKHHIK